MNMTIYYMSLYVFVVLVAFAATYLHLVSNSDVLIAALSLVLGHGTGLFTPSPETKGNING